MNRTGNVTAHPSAITFFSSHLFLVILFFSSFPFLSCLLESDFLLGGGSEYEGPSFFHGTAIYQRHSREREEVTSVC